MTEGEAAAPAPLLAALARLGIGGDEVAGWARAPAGVANLTWRVELTRGRLVAVQVPGGRERTSGIDRGTTLELCRAAARAGVTPPVLLAEAGVLVQQWVEPVAPFDLGRHVERAVLVLRRLHGLVHRLPRRSPVAWAERYRADLDAAGLRPSDVLGDPAAEALEEAMDALRRDPRPAVTSHGDLVAGNVLVTADRAYLIDFEWAGAAEPLADVAGLWASTSGDLRLLDALVDRYAGERRDDDRLRARRLALLRHAVDAIWRCLRSEDPSSSAAAAGTLADELRRLAPRQ